MQPEPSSSKRSNSVLSKLSKLEIRIPAEHLDYSAQLNDWLSKYFPNNFLKKETRFILQLDSKIAKYIQDNIKESFACVKLISDESNTMSMNGTRIECVDGVAPNNRNPSSNLDSPSAVVAEALVTLAECVKKFDVSDGPLSPEQRQIKQYCETLYRQYDSLKKEITQKDRLITEYTALKTLCQNLAQENAQYKAHYHRLRTQYERLKQSNITDRTSTHILGNHKFTHEVNVQQTHTEHVDDMLD